MTYILELVSLEQIGDLSAAEQIVHDLGETFLDDLRVVEYERRLLGVNTAAGV